MAALVFHGAATLSGLFVHAPKECVIGKPIVVHHFSGGDFQAIFPHTLAVAEDNASISIMDFFESINDGEQSVIIGGADLVATNGGRVQYVSMQDESDTGPKHVQLNSSRAGRDANIVSAFVNLGASWVRNESINHMQDSGAF